MPDYASLFILGLTYGLTVCSLTCLPYLAPYLMGAGQGFRSGVTDTVYFVGGKLLTYAALGGAAGLLGRNLDLSSLRPWVMGVVLIIAGLSLLFSKKKEGCKCKKRRKRTSLVALGVGSSLAPCPPLAAIFLLAAKQGAVLSGAACGLIYGLGLVLSPLLIAGGGLSFISAAMRKRLGSEMRYVEGLASLVMVVMGGMMIAL